jgi:hypothetical protein
MMLQATVRLWKDLAVALKLYADDPGIALRAIAVQYLLDHGKLDARTIPDTFRDNTPATKARRVR